MKWSHYSTFSTGICLFEVNYGNTRTVCEICSNLTVKTAEWRHWRRSGAFIVTFEHILHIVLVFPSLTLNKQMPGGFINFEHNKQNIQYITLHWSSVFIKKTLHRYLIAGLLETKFISNSFQTSITFPLKISSVNVTKFAGNCGFGHIYWKKSLMETSFLVQCHMKTYSMEVHLTKTWFYATKETFICYK